MRDPALFGDEVFSLESLVQRLRLKPSRLDEVQSDDKRQDNVFLYSSSVVEFGQDP